MKATNSVTVARRAAAARKIAKASKASVFSNVSTFGIALFVFDIAVWIVAFSR